MKILGIRVDEVDIIQALCKITAFIKAGKPSQIITLNAEILYCARSNEQLKKIIEDAALVTPDGTGILWASQQLGHPLNERVTGIDLMVEICHQAPYSSWKIYLLGAAPSVAAEAAERLREKYHNIDIVGTHDGYFDAAAEPELLAEIKEAAPDIIFVAMGAPRQELWIAEHQDELGVPVLMGVGGSFDVIAGRVKRAPESFQRLRLEWLWRILREPRRIKRATALPKFVLAVKKARKQQEKIQAEMERRRQR